MSVARVYSATVIGVQAHVIEVEAHLACGLPSLSLVGLPDTAVNESRDRVRAAVANSELKWPTSRITVGLSPAWLHKRGAGLDLAIALAILAADGQLPLDVLATVVAIGELGLDGRIRPVAGALAAALAIRGSNLSNVFTGPIDADQMSIVPSLEVAGVPSLRHAVARLRGEQEPEGVAETLLDVRGLGSADQRETTVGLSPRFAADLRDVRGQARAKRALEVAAAGGHHVALLGRAGIGKTLLAERIVDLLPDLGDDDALEVTAIHQLAGQHRPASGLVRRPPWLAPHHSASRAAIVGGGSHDKPSIGVISLAHRGVLFLDEAAEFDPSVVDSLREPMDSGEVSIVRTGLRMTYPARFQLVVATNPCPCGNALDTDRAVLCSCTPHQRRRYLGRLSGPLLDRLDLRVVMNRPTMAELSGLHDDQESTAQVAARVAGARQSASKRLRTTPWRLMGGVPPEHIRKHWPLSRSSQCQLDRACGNDSVRGRDRVLRVAWTIADLAGHADPTIDDVDLALDLRSAMQAWAA